jgi:hypothetical protein
VNMVFKRSSTVILKALSGSGFEVGRRTCFVGPSVGPSHHDVMNVLYAWHNAR